MSPKEVVTGFLERLDKRDIDGLAALMSEDHLFVDSLGNTVRDYFAMRPDYRITCQDILAAGRT